MSETTAVAPRRVTSADLYAQARELQAKAAEQAILVETAEDPGRRQFHSSAGKAYALWAIEIEKNAVTLAIIEQQIDTRRKQIKPQA